jgi:lipoprotein-releasing system ATP-binding protein
LTAGEYVAISGASGSGKSTLLQLLGGLDVPTSGQVLFRGCPARNRISTSTSTAPATSASSSRRSICLPTLRALENVQVPMLAGGLPTHHRAERAQALLSEMGLDHRLHSTPTSFRPASASA